MTEPPRRSATRSPSTPPAGGGALRCNHPTRPRAPATRRGRPDRGRRLRAAALLPLLAALALPACGRRHPEPDPVRERMTEMRQAVRRDRPDRAIEAMDEAIALRPANAELVLIKARLLFDFGRYADAAEAASLAARRAASAVEDAERRAAEARDQPSPAKRERNRVAAERAYAEALRVRAQALFVRAASLRSAGDAAAAEAELERAKVAFEQLAQGPSGEDEAERAQALLSAMLHKAAILRLQNHTEAAVFQIRQVEAKFPDWRGASTWIELLRSHHAERRLYDAMLAEPAGEAE